MGRKTIELTLCLYLYLYPLELLGEGIQFSLTSIPVPVGILVVCVTITISCGLMSCLQRTLVLIISELPTTWLRQMGISGTWSTQIPHLVPRGQGTCPRSHTWLRLTHIPLIPSLVSLVSPEVVYIHVHTHAQVQKGLCAQT